MSVQKNPKELIISWYNFESCKSVLCIDDNLNIFSESLRKKDLNVSIASISQSAENDFVNKNEALFDYIIAVGTIEKCFSPEFLLKQWNRLLKQDGTLIIATPNRLGIQYFCGDRDPFTHNSFDSLENYRRISSTEQNKLGGRLYSRFEIETLLKKAQFNHYKFYSVYPNLDVPQLVYADDYLPNEDLNLRILPRYNDPNSVFIDERRLYDTLVKNGLFHTLANAFFIECPKNGHFSTVRHATLPVFRDETSFITIIRNDGFVEKRIVDAEGASKLQKMQEYALDLKKHGIKVLDMKIEGNSLVMPYVDAPSAVYYLRDLLQHDKEAFLSAMDHFKDLVEQSSEHVGNAAGETVLKRGYMDLVPINAFYKDGDFVFYDQEFYSEALPAKVIIWRAILFIYDEQSVCESKLPMKFLFDRYNIDNAEQLADKYVEPFMDKLLSKKEYSEFNNKTQQNWRSIDYNYRCINNGFVSEKYLLDTCFEGLEGKKVYVFGSGKYADKFLAFYKDDYDIAGVLDNNLDKQGGDLRGVSILSPEILCNLNPDDYKVIICISKYGSVYRQLKEMGVKNIGLYFVNYIYPGRQTLVPMLDEKTKFEPKKKYHIGYIAGVFDLYHLGHLNMFRRAKEQCDYLIVGVTSDRYVRELKKKEPFIPFEERLEMVRSCKYVDEAHEIPFEYGGTVEAFQKYHFDVQFSGSDYVNNSWWLEQQKWLRDHGADLVFFPYTEQTSSTKIKALIEKGLL